MAMCCQRISRRNWSSGRRRQLPAVEPDRAIEASDVLRQQAHQRQSQAALAAAGLADDADRLATMLNSEGDAIDRSNDATVAGVVPEMEVIDDEQRHASRTQLRPRKTSAGLTRSSGSVGEAIQPSRIGLDRDVILTLQPVHNQYSPLGIGNPILRHTRSGVEHHLADASISARARGKNLDDDVRRLIESLGLVDAKARIADHDEIWLNNVVSYRDKVDWMREDPAAAARTHEPLQDPIEVGNGLLVIATWRGIHDQLSLRVPPAAGHRPAYPGGRRR